MCISVDTSQEGYRNLLVFSASGLDCAFPLEAVQEVVPMALLSVPPGLPSGLAGFLDLRGTAVPIVRMDRLFDLAEQIPGLYTPFIILRGGGAPTGVLVNAVREILRLEVKAFLPLPEDQIFHACATSALELDGSLVYLLSPERILVEHERSLLAGFQAVAQTRLNHLEARL